ncbi:DUF397 domain-containing protein [Micromonospora sp. NPDC051296]|uniref:DUF397 domain-containing protein n=1 Tax=Micromonospora sp. NPDC051296 TaxID=3155046 RepID=UPI003417235B
MDAPDLGDVTWRKSTRSGANGNCLEAADLQHMIAIRDSKDPGGPALIFTTGGWAAFVEGIKGGEGSR